MRRFSVVATLLLASGVQASPYIGVSVGSANVQIDDAKLTLGQGGVLNVDTDKLDMDKSRLTGGLYGGYQFNPYFALEATLGGVDAIDGKYFTLEHMDYLSLAPKVSLPIGDRFNLFAKWGLAYYAADLSINIPYYGNISERESNISGIVGLGAQYQVSDRFALRASWDYLRPELEYTLNSTYGQAKAKTEIDINLFTVGLSYSF